MVAKWVEEHELEGKSAVAVMDIVAGDGVLLLRYMSPPATARGRPSVRAGYIVASSPNIREYVVLRWQRSGRIEPSHLRPMCPAPPRLSPDPLALRTARTRPAPLHQ